MIINNASVTPNKRARPERNRLKAGNQGKEIPKG